MAEQDSTDIFADGVDKVACSACGNVFDVSGRPPFAAVQCPQCNNRVAVPGMFGPYQLSKCLGKGGYGATYRGIEKFLKRPVAVKVIRKACAKDETVVENFFREARILASLNHPNVAHVYSLGVHKEQPYIVMELLVGGRMDKLFRERAMDEAKALDIAIDVTEGLIATHEKELVHGDVKPSNILLDETGTAKLVDFGMVRLGGDVSSEGLAGTPYYISPEQAQNQKIDFRSDIYSLGATLFHALAGRPPFEGQTLKQVVAARLEKAAPNLSTVRQDLSPQTCAVVARMMATDPAGRHATYADLLSDLCDAHRVASRRGALPPAPSPTVAALPPSVRSQAGAKTVHMQPVRVARKSGLDRALPWIIAAGAIIIVGMLLLVFGPFP